MMLQHYIWKKPSAFKYWWKNVLQIIVAPAYSGIDGNNVTSISETDPTWKKQHSNMKTKFPSSHLAKLPGVQETFPSTLTPAQW